jgi:hypothetical protein
VASQTLVIIKMQIVVTIVTLLISFMFISNWEENTIVVKIIGILSTGSSLLSVASLLIYQIRKIEKFKFFSGSILFFTLPLLTYLLFTLDSKIDSVKSGSGFGVLFIGTLLLLVCYYVYTCWNKFKRTNY